MKFRRVQPLAPERGVILIVVLFVMMSLIVVTTAMLSIATAERSGANATAGRHHARDAARSGLETLIQLFERERDVILAGGLPELPETPIVLWEADGMQATIVLAPFDPDDRRAVPENAKADLSSETLDRIRAAALLADVDLSVLGTSAGDAPSLAALLSSTDLPASAVYGPLDSITLPAANGEEPDDRGERLAAFYDDTVASGLMSMVTVHAVEPNVDRDGAPRILCRGEWTDIVADAIDERLGDDIARAVRPMFDDGADGDVDPETESESEADPESESDPVNDDAASTSASAGEGRGAIARALASASVPPETWADALDVLTRREDTVIIGRININHASAASLQAAGFDESTATAIVETRETVSSDALASPAWLLSEGVVDEATFIDVIDGITTRSWRYRIRFVASVQSADEPGEDVARPSTGGPPTTIAASDLAAPLVAWEAVIDCSSSPPRVVDLRDVTHLVIAARLIDAPTMAFADDAEDNAMFREPDDEFFATGEGADDSETPVDTEAFTSASDSDSDSRFSSTSGSDFDTGFGDAGEPFFGDSEFPAFGDDESSSSSGDSASSGSSTSRLRARSGGVNRVRHRGPS